MGAPIAERRLSWGLRTRALEVAGPGPPLVLLHGYADSADTWRPLLDELAGVRRSAIALDMPGFGTASRLEREAEVLPQLDRFAAAAVDHALKGAAEATEVVLAGNSLGGCVRCAPPRTPACRSPA